MSASSNRKPRQRTGSQSRSDAAVRGSTDLQSVRRAAIRAAASPAPQTRGIGVPRAAPECMFRELAKRDAVANLCSSRAPGIRAI